MSTVHWTYKEGPTDDLEQGDLLAKTPYLSGVLSKYHPHYANHPDNTLFIVLTQSCDLVRRKNQCKSEYIAIAPVRPLIVVLDREFSDQILNKGATAQAIAPLSVQIRYRDTLTKIFNNNYPKYFFLHRQPDKGLAEDMCAVLPLSISIKQEHYDECLKARRLQLDDAFQAKLGYLIGQQYSKVGTRDWGNEEIIKKVDDILEGVAVWVNDTDLDEIRESIKNYELNNDGRMVDANALQGLLQRIQTKKDKAVVAVMDFLAENNLVSKGPSNERFKLRKALANNPTFSQFFKER